jgi:hypothetical protein
MIRRSSILSMFLSGLLFYLSISASYGYFLPDNDHLTKKSNSTPAYWFAEAPILINLTKPFKNPLKGFKNFSVSGLQNFVNDFKTSWELAELNIATTSSRYITFSKTISYRLEIKEIIFPFHYFW